MTDAMTDAARTAARLALSLRQRHFEWQLARDQQTAAAARFVRGQTHDLMNMIQIVQLASSELEQRCDPTGKEFIADLRRAASDAHVSMKAMMELAQPAERVVRGAPVGPCVTAALETLRDVVRVEIRLAPPPDTATRCTADDLEHLLVGLALDLAGHDEPIELFVRERTISGARWIEIVRSSPIIPAGDRFELRVVEAIAERAGGELATSDRRGGGEELVVALPVVA